MNIIPYRVLYEDWMEVFTPGGVMVKVRGTLAVMMEEGPEKFGFRFQAQFQTVASKGPWGLPHPMTKTLGKVPLLSAGVAKSAYETPMGIVVVATRIKEMHRTDGIDQHGEPIFNVQVEHNIEIRGPPKQKDVAA